MISCSGSGAFSLGDGAAAIPMVMFVFHVSVGIPHTVDELQDMDSVLPLLFQRVATIYAAGQIRQDLVAALTDRGSHILRKSDDGRLGLIVSVIFLLPRMNSVLPSSFSSSISCFDKVG